MTKVPAGARPPDLDHLRWLEKHGAGAFPGARVLDLGCGSGFLCAEARRRGATSVVGVDLLPPDTDPSEGGWRFMQADLEADRWDATLGGDGSFDWIFAFDILEHLTAPARFLDACARLLSKGGRLVLTTPNTASWERLVKGPAWSGATDMQHKVLFSRYSLGFLLARCGFEAQVLTAPLRSLERAGPLCPQVGAQIFCLAQRNSFR